MTNNKLWLSGFLIIAIWLSIIWACDILSPIITDEELREVAVNICKTGPDGNSKTPEGGDGCEALWQFHLGYRDTVLGHQTIMWEWEKEARKKIKREYSMFQTIGRLFANRKASEAGTMPLPPGVKGERATTATSDGGHGGYIGSVVIRSGDGPSDSSNTGGHSSGPISFTLQAGKIPSFTARYWLPERYSVEARLRDGRKVSLACSKGMCAEVLAAPKDKQ